MEREILAGGGSKESPLFAEVARAYGKRAEGVSGGTAGYLRRLRKGLAGVKVEEITGALLTEKLGVAGRKPGTVRRELAMVKAVVNWGVEMGMCESISVKLPRVSDARDRWLSEEERAKLVEVASETDAGVWELVVFLLWSGARLGEALELRWRDVDWEAQRMRFESKKGGRVKVRWVPIHPVLSGVIGISREGADSDSRVLWLGGVSRTEMYRRVKRVFLKAGMKGLRLHDLRHTFASHFAMKTGDLRALAEILGHSSMQMTMRYSHLASGHLAEKVAAL